MYVLENYFPNSEIMHTEGKLFIIFCFNTLLEVYVVSAKLVVKKSEQYGSDGEFSKGKANKILLIGLS